MADRILTWYIENPKGDGSSEGATFFLDRSYVLPAKVRIYTDFSPNGEDLNLDIKFTPPEGTATSMFSTLPTLIKGNEGNDDNWDDFDDAITLLDQFSWVSLSIPQSGGARGITVSLEINEHYEEEEVQDED